jgi:type IV secretion system protein VirB9
MRHFYLSAATAALFSASAFAAETPKSGREDGRVRFVDYSPHQVFEIQGALLHSTQIQFATDETVVHAAVGNFVWEVAPTGNIVFLKPKEAHPPTNLQVVTQRPDGSRRSYQFELSTPSIRGEPKAFLLVQFKYPSDDEARQRAVSAAKSEIDQAAVVDKILTRDEANGPRNFAYSAQGQTDFEPTEVWDNGKVTSVRFKGGVELPAIYLSREDGSEELVPKNVHGEIVMVHAVARKLVLRRGDEVMCLFNEHFVAEGLEPRTKTTSPQVARLTKTRPANGGKSALPAAAADAPRPLAPRPRAEVHPPISASALKAGAEAATAARVAAAVVTVDQALIATGSAGLPVKR